LISTKKKNTKRWANISCRNNYHTIHSIDISSLKNAQLLSFVGTYASSLTDINNNNNNNRQAKVRNSIYHLSSTNNNTWSNEWE